MPYPLLGNVTLWQLVALPFFVLDDEGPVPGQPGAVTIASLETYDDTRSVRSDVHVAAQYGPGAGRRAYFRVGHESRRKRGITTDAGAWRAAAMLAGLSAPVRWAFIECKDRLDACQWESIVGRSFVTLMSGYGPLS